MYNNSKDLYEEGTRFSVLARKSEQVIPTLSYFTNCTFCQFVENNHKHKREAADEDNMLILFRRITYYSNISTRFLWLKLITCTNQSIVQQFTSDGNIRHRARKASPTGLMQRTMCSFWRTRLIKNWNTCEKAVIIRGQYMNKRTICW